MAGQKGPEYKQGGVAIANRTPFNAYIPNKRQSVNDGLVGLMRNFDSENTNPILSNTVPFIQDTQARAIEAFLFCEDVPTRLGFQFYRESDWEKVQISAGPPVVNAALCAPALSLFVPGQLNATPSIIDGYTPYTAANGVAYGAISTGTTETAGVKVRGFSVIVENPQAYEQATRYTGSDLATKVNGWSSVFLDFSTRSSCVNGFPLYNGTGLTDNEVKIPALYLESDYTQAMQDAGNRIVTAFGVEVIIVGLYKFIVN